MDKTKLKRIFSIVLILAGAILLILELASPAKNYYLQAIGIVCLMTGLFIVNTSVSSKSQEIDPALSKVSEEEE
ncbi:hypothetical protein [uncultured Aquimarina sp.]|uniref:hypothetical protein n=1 Tax=uncultured Aquimarina sp. TaxID=575652 RepID=UPI00260E256E|nr:hypothetical protein [uncultured Aquimarina sp.]